MGPEQLRAIDAELSAFRVSEDHLIEVVDRALETVAVLGGAKSALDALGEPPAPRRLRTEPPPRRPRTEPPRPRTQPPPRARTEPPPPKQSEPPPPVKPLTAPPAPLPDLDDEPLLMDAPRSSDISGLSVDDLFADAEPTTSVPMPGEGNLASLFDDEPAHFDDAETPGSLADALADSPAEERSPFDPPTGDFEVLVDEDVLVLEEGEDEEDEPSLEGTPNDDGEPPKKGLLTRLFGQKK